MLNFKEKLDTLKKEVIEDILKIITHHINSGIYDGFDLAEELVPNGFFIVETQIDMDDNYKYISYIDETGVKIQESNWDGAEILPYTELSIELLVSLHNLLQNIK